MGRMIYIPFSFNIPIGGGIRIFEDKPLSFGTIRTVQIHWPDGCNGLVDVAVWYGNQIQLIPQTGTGYLALNDATPTYSGFNHVKSDDVELWVDMRNRDAVNTHQITVVVGIETTEGS